MVEIVLKKRRAREGEIGLFLETPAFEDEWQQIKMDTDVDVSATQRGTEKYMRFSHVLAKLVADCNGEIFTDAQDARDALLIECKHVVRKFDKLRQEAKLIPKATRDLDATAWLRLIKLMSYHAVATFNVPPEQLERHGREYSTQRGSEPPPHTEIPDGPAAAPAPAEPAAERPAEPARRGFDDEDDGEGEAARPDPAPPAAAPAAAAPPPDREPVTWTVDMAGEPDWRVDKPGDAGTYAAFARAVLARTTDRAQWIVWWNSDEQFNLRVALQFGIMNKRSIEQLAAEKEWRT